MPVWLADKDGVLRLFEVAKDDMPLPGEWVKPHKASEEVLRLRREICEVEKNNDHYFSEALKNGTLIDTQAKEIARLKEELADTQGSYEAIRKRKTEMWAEQNRKWKLFNEQAAELERYKALLIDMHGSMADE